MPNPTRGDVHVNTPLTNISIAYIQSSSHFIADQAFPNVPVSKQSDRYYTYDRADFNRDEMEVRGSGSESKGSGYEVDNTPTYYAPIYAYHKDIEDPVRANADSVLAPDRDATTFVTQKAMIKRERTFAVNYMRTGVWGTSVVGVPNNPTAGQFLVWGDAASTPIEDIRAAKRTVLENTGFEPNKIVLGKAVYDTLVDHPDIVDRVKYGQTPGNPAMVNANSLAQLFELEQVLVSKAVYNAAAKGAAEDSNFIVGSHALLCYATPTPGLMIPTAGYTFSWTGYLGASTQGHRISRFRMEHLKSDRVEVEMAYQQKLVAADLGYFFESAVVGQSG